MATKRRAVAELLADDRRLQKGLDRAQKRFGRFAKNTKRTLSRAFSGMKGIAGIGAGFGLAGMGREVLGFEDRLQRVGSQARFTRGELNGFRDAITGVSDETGLGRDVLLDAVEKVVDLQGASGATTSNLQTMATALLATGSAGEDMAGLMFALNENLSVTETEAKAALSAIDAIGAEKSIPFKDLSADLAALSGSAKSFGVEGVEGTAKLVAAMQVLRTRFKGSAEVATGLQGAMTAFLKKESKLKKFGVHVRDNNGELRDLFEIIEDIANSKLGDAAGSGKLLDVLGRAEAFRAVQGLIQDQKELQRLTALGTSSGNFLDVRAEERLSSTPGKIAKQWNQVKLTIAKAFTPERLEKFARVLEKIADLVEKAFDNPGKTLALLAGLKFGPGAVSALGPLALSGAAKAAGGSLLGQGVGAAAGSIGAAKTAGLVGLAGAAGYALGQWIDDLTGASDALSDLALEIFGGPELAKTDGNTSEGIERLVAEGKITEEEAAKRTRGLRQTFEFAGVNALVNQLGNSLVSQGAIDVKSGQANVAANREEIMALGRELMREQAAGRDATAQAERIAELLAGRPVEVHVNAEVLAKTAENAVTERIR